VLDTTVVLGLEVRDHGLKPPPGVPLLPPGVVQVTAYYASDEDSDDAEHRVRCELPGARTSRAAFPEEDWAEGWKRHIRPVRVGRVWVGPPWERVNAGDAPVAIVIEPGMAFGTGDHPTTALCLGAIDELMATRPGASVLDVGTGSGVLAIAARRLGAGRVVGNDIDPIAVRIARENARDNGTPELEIVDRPVERIAGTFDIVVANLFANVLCQLAPRLVARTAPGGVLLLSGILQPQLEEVEQAFAREGVQRVERRLQGEWALLIYGR